MVPESIVFGIRHLSVKLYFCGVDFLFRIIGSLVPVLVSFCLLDKELPGNPVEELHLSYQSVGIAF